MEQRLGQPDQIQIEPVVEESPSVKEVDWGKMFSRATKLAETAFQAEFGGDFTLPGDDWCTGDAATAYTLVTTDDGKERLVPVGWGEFSRQTFERGDKRLAFKTATYDIFVVEQRDSYFAEGKVKDLMENNPREYLRQKAKMVARQGKVTRAEKVGRGIDTELRDYDFQEVPYLKFMADTRNLILKTGKIYGLEEPVDVNDFARFVGEMPRDSGELAKFVKKVDLSNPSLSDKELRSSEVTEGMKQARREDAYLSLMWGMGVNGVGSAVGDERAMRSMIDLAESFDQETKEFKPQEVS